jgi:PilZ domain-containing protein
VAAVPFEPTVSIGVALLDKLRRTGFVPCPGRIPCCRVPRQVRVEGVRRLPKPVDSLSSQSEPPAKPTNLLCAVPASLREYATWRMSRAVTEQRKAPRQRTLKGGRIVFNEGYASFSCIIRNLSARGAKLQLESVLGIPSEFTLMFDDGSPPRICIIRWREPTSLGVEFM